LADLIAQGPRPQDRWRRKLQADQPALLGRLAGSLDASWDDRISRRHAELRLSGDRLQVRKLSGARNPIFWRGEQQEDFEIAPGDHFVIGRTTFTLVDFRVQPTIEAPNPQRQQTFSAQYLQQVEFRNARARIEVLGRLPEVIRGAGSQDELLVRLTNMLLAGIPKADAVAMVRVLSDSTAGPSGDTAEQRDAVDHATGEAAIDVLHWDRRLLSGAPFEPSARLIRQSIASGESVLHVWGRNDEPAYTVREDVDWAFCTPVAGNVCRGWAIYVAGRFTRSPGEPSTDPTDLRDDLKFTEVAADTMHSLLQVQHLQRQQAVIGQFLSPVVIQALRGEDAEAALAPRQAEVTVMFCDLRGFSRESERSADHLLELLGRVSRALGVVTRHIRQCDGVVGDFQGDAVMGFWGWPMADGRPISQACRAALNIRAELENVRRADDDPLAGFQLGIGLATGTAVAGKIGTVDQVKMTVLGPVVNLAARLEGMTKQLQAPILIDQRTADYVREHFDPSQARCRRVAVVRPAGMEQPVEVAELLPPAGEFPALRDEHLADYEEALTHFLAGRWSEAFEKLHDVPATDRVKDFLTGLIVQHNRTPPPNWQGIIELKNK